MKTGAALALLLSAVAGAAQPVPDARTDILVTGDRFSLSARAGAFVSAVTAETGSGQLARWDRRLCLAVEGVSDAQRQFLSGRIAVTGHELGLEVETGRRCEPSALIVFTSDPARLVQRIEDTRPRFFGRIPPERRRALLVSTRPVRWLSFAGVRGADGEAPSSFIVERHSGGAERPVPLLRATPSRVGGGPRMDLQSMIVVVDAGRLTGISNRSLADYLAMVVLGNVRNGHPPTGARSILGLFEEARAGALVTEGLSEWDRAYLSALYSGTWNLPAEQHVQRIASNMVRTLSAGGGEEAD